MDGAPELVHATAIACGPAAALIRGASGSGKSDLALRCLAAAPTPLMPFPALLVADDWVSLSRNGGVIEARAPESIRGKLEIRGLGILSVPHIICAPLALIVDLVSPGGYERLPDPRPTATLLGLELPLVLIAPFEVSAPQKLLLALIRLAVTDSQ